MKQSKLEENPFLRLTDDLLLDIMHRLPVRSLKRCEAVCKPWHSLISDPDFVESHLEYCKENYLPLTLVSQKHNVISAVKFKDPADITEGITIEPLDEQFVDDDYDGYCFIVGSCDGLICLYLRENKRRYGDSLYVWNPATDEEMEVSLPVRRACSYFLKESSWFGYVPSSDDYKIFLVFSLYKPYDGTCMYLYSFRYGRWREVVFSDEDADYISFSNSVFLYEALHYLVLRKWIYKLNLVTESFEKIPFSIKPDLLPEYQQVLLGVIGEDDCLCAMFMRHAEDYWMFELWTLEEYGKWDSWAKLYRIDLQKDIVYCCLEFLGFTYSGELCIQTEDGVMLVDPSLDPPSIVRSRDRKVYEVMDYVESLLSPESIP